MARVTVTSIPGGDAGTFQTLQTMRTLARRGAFAPGVLQLAGRLRMAARANRCAYVARLRAWLSRYVLFEYDPPKIELVREPQYMLDALARDGYAAGDCDDVAVLAAALGLYAGIPARYVVYAFGSPVAPFSHVFTELQCGGRWVELDTTAPDQFETWHAPARRSTLTV